MTDIYSQSTADIAQWLLDTTRVALDECNREPITTAYVAAGAVAWDDCCGSLIVAPERVFFTETFPIEDTTEVICDEGYLSAQFVVILLRCLPNMDSRGNPPSAASLTAAYNSLMGDAAIVMNALAGPLPSQDWERTRPAQSFIGAEGGCIGVETRITIGIPQTEWAICCTEPQPHVPGGPLCRPNADQVVFTPCEELTATNVQDAICELAQQVANPVYGSFLSMLDQQLAISTPGPMALSATLEANDVSIIAGTEITFARDCTINLQFSAQIYHRGGGGNGESLWIWLDLNGTAVPDSAGRIRVQNNQHLVASWNYVLSMSAGDHLRLMWEQNNARIVLEHENAIGVIPAVPSLIVTVSPVS